LSIKNSIEITQIQDALDNFYMTLIIPHRVHLGLWRSFSSRHCSRILFDFFWTPREMSL